MGVYNRKESKPRPLTSLQTREKMSKTRKGNHLNPKEFKKGHVAYNKNKSPSKETREKMSESGKVKIFTEEHRKNMSKAGKGRIFTEEHKRKIGVSRIGKKRLDMIGENNFNYIDGRTPENRRIRSSSEMKLLKKVCFERDNFTCAKYGTRGGELVMHHINNFADFPELRLALDNVITLSKKAHKEFHKKYGIKNNTREQLEEFLKT